MPRKKESEDELESLRARVAELEQEHRRYREVESALRESEEKYRTFVQTIPDIVYTIDEEGYFTFVSDCIEQLGYKPEELLGKHFSVILHSDDLEDVSRSSVLKKYEGKRTGDRNAPRLFDERRTRTRKTANLEVRLIQKGVKGFRSGLIDVMTEVSASGFYSKEISDGDKKFIGTVGVIRDITERKTQEEALRESESKLKGVLDAIADCICMIDTDLNIIWANEPFINLFSREAASGKCYNAIKKKDHPCDILHCIAGKAFRDGEVHEQDLSFQDLRGEMHYFHCTSNVALKDMKGNPVTAILFLRDMTEYFKAEEARRASQQFAKNIIDSSIDMIIAVDKNRRIIEFNKAAQEAFGYTAEEILGKSIEMLYASNEESSSIYEEVLKTGKTRKEIHNRRKNGDIFPALLSSSVLIDKEGSLVGIMGVSRDTTEIKKMEDELLRAQKLESIGILAGGIAHDFNNILTAILGNVSLALYARQDEEIKRRLRETEKAALRAQDLTYQLLTFSKGGAPVKKTSSLKDLIRDSAGFASRGTNVRVEYDFEDESWTVEIDEGQMSQVINNMVINAVQAMPNGGVISISTINENIEHQSVLPLNVGKYVRIAVRDTGIGIPSEHFSRIFDPYFTTKQKGSGLGLATSYSIIKNHEGIITVESELGLGTTFYIYLPASPHRIVKSEASGNEPVTGSGHILIMDDEEAIREILGGMLNRLGYSVSFACDGNEAIEIYKKAMESGSRIDAVIMDLTIPGGMGGRECVEKLKQYDNNVRAIVSSGYSNDPVMANFSQFGFSGCVSKPYRLEQLGGILDRIIGS
ncbi:MAG: PAS domain S-box protein [Candidatus Xenobiia bacterium LiM19]